MARQCFERNSNTPCIRLESDDFLDNKRGRVWRIDGAVEDLGIKRWDIVTIHTTTVNNIRSTAMTVIDPENGLRFTVRLAMVGGNDHYLTGRHNNFIFFVFALWDRTDGSNLRRGIYIEVFADGSGHSMPDPNYKPDETTCPTSPIPIVFQLGKGMTVREMRQDNEGNGYEDPP